MTDELKKEMKRLVREKWVPRVFEVADFETNVERPQSICNNWFEITDASFENAHDSLKKKVSRVFDVAESNQNENYQASFVLYTNDLFILWKYRARAFKMRNNVTKLKILVQI